MKKRKSVGRKLGALLRGLMLWPFAGILAVLGVRFATISNPGRIGHLAAEVDAFLKERALGLIPDDRPILLLQRDKAANAALLDLIGTQVTVWDARWQAVLFRPFTKITPLWMPLGRPVVGLGEAARYYQLNTIWEDRGPTMPLTDALEARGRARLAEMGVPQDAWFVAIHAREGGYSPGDEATHAHRNADIASYGLAIQEIRARGGWVVRMGDPSMTPMAPMEGVVDYALSPLKADWMDLWLCAHTRFLLGTSSGLIMPAAIFQRPCALVNMAPHGSAYGVRPGDISIVKGAVRADGSVMPLSEVFDSGLSRQRYAYVFEERGVRLQNNSAEEVRDLTVEMLDRLEGRFETTLEDDDLQRRFRALLTPHDYAFGAAARLGREWWRQNKHLLPE